MLVHITAKHIANGAVHSRSCPIALALHDLGFLRASVGMATYSVDGTYDGTGLLPAVARVFVRDFVHGKPVEPFSVELDEAPTWWRTHGCLVDGEMEVVGQLALFESEE